MFGMFYKYKNHLELCTVHKHVLALATDARWNTCKTTDKEWQRYRCIYASMVWYGLVCNARIVGHDNSSQQCVCVCMLAIVICASATNKTAATAATFNQHKNYLYIWATFIAFDVFVECEWVLSSFVILFFFCRFGFSVCFFVVLSSLEFIWNNKPNRMQRKTMLLFLR